MNTDTDTGTNIKTDTDTDTDPGQRLDSLRPGQTGTVVEFFADEPGDSTQIQRLQDIGFVAGTAVTAERRAPLGDPTVYRVRGTRIALRRAAATLIGVRLTAAPPHNPATDSSRAPNTHPSNEPTIAHHP